MRIVFFLVKMSPLGDIVTKPPIGDKQISRQAATFRNVAAWRLGLFLRAAQDIATTSNVYGDLGMDAKRRIQRKLVAFVNQQANQAQQDTCIEEAWAKTPVTIQ